MISREKKRITKKRVRIKANKIRKREKIQKRRGRNKLTIAYK